MDGLAATSSSLVPLLIQLTTKGDNEDALVPRVPRRTLNRFTSEYSEGELCPAFIRRTYLCELCFPSKYANEYCSVGR